MAEKEELFYIYSKVGCGYCDKLIDFMDKKGVIYEKFLLGEDFTTEQFLSKFGSNSTFPQVVSKHGKIGGMRDTVTYLVNNRYV